MSQEMTLLIDESKKLICDSLAKIADIVTKDGTPSIQAGAPQREVPLFFPHGIGSVSLTVTMTNVGTLTFSIAGSNSPKPDASEDIHIESKSGPTMSYK